MNKTCLKCGHANPSASGDPLEACPKCGAIYSRVEAAWAATPRPAAERTAPRPEDAEPVEAFAVGLRIESLYPTFRGLVQIVYWVWVVLAVLCFAAALVGVATGDGAARLWSFLGGVFLGVVFLIVGRVTREMALMLADLSDAAVRIASRVRP